MPGPGFDPGLLRPQRSVLTTRRSRRTTEEVVERNRKLLRCHSLTDVAHIHSITHLNL